MSLDLQVFEEVKPEDQTKEEREKQIKVDGKLVSCGIRPHGQSFRPETEVQDGAVREAMLTE